MGEILQKAGEEYRARQEREAQYEAYQRQRREESGRRKQEFIGLMQENEVPTKPIFVKHYAKGQGTNPVLARVGDGWSVKPRSWQRDGYDEGVFVAQDGTVYKCGDKLCDTSETSQPSPVPGQEYFLGSDFWREGDEAHTDYTHPAGDTLFAGDDGLSMLVNGLERNGLVIEG